MMNVGTKRILEAVQYASRNTSGGWGHPTVIAMQIKMSRSTAVRYCKELVAEGLLEGAEMYGWRYSKSVRSINFRITPRGQQWLADHQPKEET